MRTVFHALVLNFHQPAGNLDALLDTTEWEAKEILYAMDRVPRSLWGYEDIARVHLALSGTLLEALMRPEFQQRVFGVVKCGDLIWQWQNRHLFQLLGTGYYHPVLPLIPEADRDEQIRRWQGIGRHLFWRENFPGFWPPEMAFCMELIPALRRAGYRYVLVDSEHVEPVTPMRWEEIRYRPHVARYGGAEITVVVRDRDLSNAQLSGMETGWFTREVYERTKHCQFTPLVTTATDGDNGGWFRNTAHQGNFWGAFYQPLLDLVRRGETEIRPAFIDDYLDQHGVHGEVRVRTGAWNTGWHSGVGFSQWTGSHPQQEAMRRVHETSQALREVMQRVGTDATKLLRLSEAQWRLLRAQTSCNFFWGESWVLRCHADLDVAWSIMNQMT